MRGLLAGPAPEDAADGLGLRRWFIAFVGWMALLAAVALWAFGHYDTGDLEARSVWLVSIGLFYLSLCCLFVPLPTAWIVMLLASNQMGLIEPVGLRVVVVAGLCSVASGVANLNEYYLITFLLRYRRLGQVRDTRLYRWAARWFSTSPFLVVALFGFLPLPVDVVRWLAILYRYSRFDYFAAYVVGRFPRYLIWALSAVWLDLNWWQILVFQAVLVFAAGFWVIRSAWRRHRMSRTVTAELAPAGQMP